ncbi:DinB family protein [Ekhidna sp. MALMAid0563]|uniref:DinB family protein n=1 Tax=Ekhidna sp. MALMAid0563 TaxID=3143937 RepID=UPI0032DFC01E
MKFSLEKSIHILERTPAVLKTLLKNLSEDWTAPNEGPDTWSPYDVVGHLIHGEKTDWIPRAKIILEQGESQPFTPFDRFAQFEESKGKTLNQLLDEFESHRTDNIKTLKALNITEADLTKTGIHPEFGAVTLENLLAAWVVHDLGHIHQISRVMAKQYTNEVGPWTQYMGVLK